MKGFRITLALSHFFICALIMTMPVVAQGASYAVPEVSNELYDAAIASGKPLFLSYNATWCPSCRKQNKSLGSLIEKFKDSAMIYTVNWDKLDEFKGPKTKQRTTIAFIKEGVIKDELIGETQADKIEVFIQPKLK